MSVFVCVHRITRASNVFSSMINSIAVSIVSPKAVVYREILVDRKTLFVFVPPVIHAINVNLIPNRSRSRSINSSRRIFFPPRDKQRLLFSSFSPCYFSSWLYQTIFSRSSHFVVVHVFVMELVTIFLR